MADAIPTKPATLEDAINHLLETLENEVAALGDHADALMASEPIEVWATYYLAMIVAAADARRLAILPVLTAPHRRRIQELLRAEEARRNAPR